MPLNSNINSNKELQRMAEDWDPQMTHALQFRNAIDGAMEFIKTSLHRRKGSTATAHHYVLHPQKNKEDTGTPSVEKEVTDNDNEKDTAPPDKASAEVVPSEEL